MSRPRKIDVEDKEVIKQVELFGSLAATQEEMASWFDVTLRTIENYMANKEGKFFRVYRKALSSTKQSLRRVQLSKACDGDNTMLIWLGKQLLNQRDKHDNENNNTNFSIITDKPMEKDEWEQKYAKNSLESPERATESSS